MSNANKVWSWGGAIGRATGSAISGAASGTMAGLLGGALSAPLAAVIGGAIGFSGGIIGAILGHKLDDMPPSGEAFGSGALFTLVVTGMLDIQLLGLFRTPLAPEATKLLLSILLGFSSLIGSASKSLLDDLFERYFAGQIADLRRRRMSSSMRDDVS